MSDAQKNPMRWQIRYLSTAQWLSIALLINLIFSAYLLSRMNTIDRVAAQPSSESYATPVPASDPSALVEQLQEIQNKLQVTSIQLAQKGSSMGIDPSVSSVQNKNGDENLPALWAEIGQLNQIMEPLMVQMEAATATQSSRSQSEIIALRTRVNTIHQRLAYLLARVDAVQARSNVGTTSSSYPQVSVPSFSNHPDAAEYQQLYQNMVQMQLMLQQIQHGLTP